MYILVYPHVFLNTIPSLISNQPAHHKHRTQKQARTHTPAFIRWQDPYRMSSAQRPSYRTLIPTYSIKRVWTGRFIKYQVSIHWFTLPNGLQRLKRYMWLTLADQFALTNDMLYKLQVQTMQTNYKSVSEYIDLHLPELIVCHMARERRSNQQMVMTGWVGVRSLSRFRAGVNYGPRCESPGENSHSVKSGTCWHAALGVSVCFTYHCKIC